MTRAHRSDVLGVAPRALARAFTLREAAALLELVGDGAHFDGETFANRARSLVAAFAAARFRRQGGADDDIGDPIGRSVEIHEQVGEAIAAALLPLLRRLADLRLLARRAGAVELAPYRAPVSSAAENDAGG